MGLTEPTVSAPSHLFNVVGDIFEVRLVAARFFETVHTYLPIISKKLFYDRLINPLLRPRADAALLCLCMKVVIWTPSRYDDDPRTEAYMAAKTYIVELEASGVFTLPVLQACILISLYELGHGIYPAAHMSISACATYGYALGLNIAGTKASYERCTWIEIEEQRRVWWSILILERYPISIIL